MGTPRRQWRSTRGVSDAERSRPAGQCSLVLEFAGRRRRHRCGSMRLDPRVAREKYDRELARLSEQRHTLERRGGFLLGSSGYPAIDLFFAPRHPLRVALPASQTGSGLVLPQNTFMLAEVPGLAARSFKARFDLSDFDLRAPSVDFRDPWTDELLGYDTMFRAL